MRILALTRYTELGASSRMRTYQYLPRLEQAGMDVDVLPFFTDSYVKKLQHKHKDFFEAMKAYAQRLFSMLGRKHYDVIWVEKECFPWMPFFFESALLPSDIPLILDYDDAVFHYYEHHSSAMIRSIFASKHKKLLQRSSLVTAGNQYIADYARASGAKQVEILPTVVDLDKYTFEKAPEVKNRPCIGWIGQRSTAHFLEPYIEMLVRFKQSERADFLAIGIDTARLGWPLDSIAWSEQTEVQSLKQLDIGIMPLIDAPFERGKSGYKLIQYMACGLPVVASPVGVNATLVEHGINGFLAENESDWLKYLNILVDDRHLREEMGARGRSKVEREYCLDATAPKMIELLKKASGT